MDHPGADAPPHDRARVAHELGQEESYFWPSLLSTEQSRSATESELVQIWPTRQLVPGDVWRTLFRQATEQIDVLVYAGNFLIEAYDLVEVIRTKVRSRRRASGFCSATASARRSTSAPGRNVCRASWTAADRAWSTRPRWPNCPGVQIRLHQTVLYASQFRFDESMLVNNHTYGSPGSAITGASTSASVPGGQLFDYYQRAYERVWATGEPVP